MHDAPEARLPTAADLACAYGCTIPMAEQLLAAADGDLFPTAVAQLGPIRVWFSQAAWRWTLDQRPACREEIIRAWMRLRQGRAA